MADEMNPEQDQEKRHELYEQVAAMFVMQGIPVSEEVQLYMQPLLDGSMHYEEHRRMLEALLKIPA